ncbi:MAG: DNA translocase FtsK [Planctomycetes bacterium]|nr:DNA translocase FtsK [Planctomycetota bacterium]
MNASLAILRDNRRFRELIGLLALVFGAFSLLALLSYRGVDPTWFDSRAVDGPVGNWMGSLGAFVAELLLQGFGVVVFVLPFAVAAWGWDRLRREESHFSGAHVAAYVALGLALCSLVELLFSQVRYGGETFEPGGLVGSSIAGVLRALLNTSGALLVSAAIVAAVVILSTRTSFLRVAELTARGAKTALRAVRTWAEGWIEARKEERRRAPVVSQAGAAPAKRVAAVERPAVSVTEAPVEPRRTSITLEKNEPEAQPPPAAPKVASRPKTASRGPTQAALPMEKGQRGYSLPQLDLLNEVEPQSRESEQELLDRAKQITTKFREFSIDGTVVAIHPGPVVTTFEFKPEAGVKYSKITGMTEDLSLALKAVSVRIDRLPGRSTVGIEVPNRRQEVIYPRELLSSSNFRDSSSKLPLALGKDIHGDVAVAELDRMPHLLIAGATGAGKSVGLNGMIISMLYKSTPEDLRMIMIDTKMIELGIYADIPHLLIPVVTDPKHASAALKWAVREMELRYRMLAAVGVRNISQFNTLLAEEPGRTMDHPKTGEPVELKHLPYIVIVIDEMADLMMVSAGDVEESVMRLAQMARAVGIHLILATQRPSVDVITGTIKANFPSRIAFRVSQRVDSRTIIDQQGAEHLLGRGDMLFLPTGSSILKRLHSGFITEGEINRIVSCLKKMAEPEYDETVLDDTEGARGEVDPGDRDEMYNDAVRTVIHEGKCSITLIQRRLQLGYARAARIVDMMEQAGVVSPGEGSKPREVLVGPEILDAPEARP